MPNILTIASGKGGVGKSSIAVNLAITLSNSEHSVILCDFDFGGANLHTLLGLKNNHIGIGNFVYRQNKSLSELLQETGIKNLKFIAGDCLFPGTANMDFFIKKKILKDLETLDSEYIIIDLGAGSSYNTLDFFLMTYNSIVVTTPELTSIMNAYSFLKSSAFRFFSQQFKARSEERKYITSFFENQTSGSEASFVVLVDSITKEFPETGTKAKLSLEKFHPQVILNNTSSSSDLEMARRLRSLVESKLNIKINFIGVLPKDSNVPLAVLKRTPACVLSCECPFSKAIRKTSEHIMDFDYELNTTLENNEEDELEYFKKEFL